MSKWIFCEEKLPFKKDEVGIYRSDAVIITDGTMVKEGDFIGGHGGGKPWIMWSPYNEIKPDDVVAWMQMPVGPLLK